MDDIAILENMENQYLIAEHYYDLTEYIDQNIYRFKRNGRYLQEGFGTVALWIAGIALAAGIGVWVYNTFFSKSKEEQKNKAVTAQKTTLNQIVQSSESEAAEANKAIGDAPRKVESIEKFAGGKFYMECLENMRKSIEGVKDDKEGREKLIKALAQKFASEFGIEESTAETLLRANQSLEEANKTIEDKKQEVTQKQTTFKEVLNVVLSNPIVKFIGNMLKGMILGAGLLSVAYLATGIPLLWGAMPLFAGKMFANGFVAVIAGAFAGGTAVGTWEGIKNSLDPKNQKADSTFQNSVKAALYLINYFITIEIILEQEELTQKNSQNNAQLQSQQNSIAEFKNKNKKNFELIKKAIDEFVPKDGGLITPGKKLVLNLNQIDDFYKNINTIISSETMNLLNINSTTKIPTIAFNISSDDFIQNITDVNVDLPLSGAAQFGQYQVLASFCKELLTNAQKGGKFQQAQKVQTMSNQTNIVNTNQGEIRSWSEFLKNIAIRANNPVYQTYGDSIQINTLIDVKSYHDMIGMIQNAAHDSGRQFNDLILQYINLEFNNNKDKASPAYSIIYQLKDKMNKATVKSYVEYMLLSTRIQSYTFEQWLKDENKPEQSLAEFLNASEIKGVKGEIQQWLKDHNKLPNPLLTKEDQEKLNKDSNNIKDITINSIGIKDPQALDLIARFNKLKEQYNAEKTTIHQTEITPDSYYGAIEKVIKEILTRANEVKRGDKTVWSSTDILSSPGLDNIDNENLNVENYFEKQYTNDVSTLISTKSPGKSTYTINGTNVSVNDLRDEFKTKFTELKNRANEYINNVKQKMLNLFNSNEEKTKTAFKTVTAAELTKDNIENHTLDNIIKVWKKKTQGKPVRDLQINQISGEGDTKKFAIDIDDIISGREKNPNIQSTATTSTTTTKQDVTPADIPDANGTGDAQLIDAANNIYTLTDSASNREPEKYIYKQAWNVLLNNNIDFPNPIEKFLSKTSTFNKKDYGKLKDKFTDAWTKHRSNSNVTAIADDPKISSKSSAPYSWTSYSNTYKKLNNYFQMYK